MLFVKPWFRQRPYSPKIKLAGLVVKLSEKLIQQKIDITKNGLSSEAESFVWSYTMLKSRYMNKMFWMDAISGKSSNERYLHQLVPLLSEELRSEVDDVELMEVYEQIASTAV
ncbi:hypothetical protein [Hydrotalea sandarakina]|jgi:hypothetical protein|uniref:Uncharacterized protein n=1 Tax=Hydrotalea sandarakina TaxID=1004304 RepID=A0A2W7RVJ2_9BACT|nr:hypothetical protein [Hydrotalea sandarakina]PZX64743.1 hypothetical protein LX80_00944 [Hydrotalea sandarakina]